MVTLSPIFYVLPVINTGRTMRLSLRLRMSEHRMVYLLVSHTLRKELSGSVVECLMAHTYCIYCDKHWEDHETFFETEDVRAQNGLPVGKSYLTEGAQWLSGRVAQW